MNILLILLFVSFALLVAQFQKNIHLKIVFILSSLASVALAILGQYVMLPQSGSDAIRFEEYAWQLSHYPLSEIFASFKSSSAHNHSVITAVFYHYLGRGYFVSVFQNLILYVLLLHVSMKILREVWPNCSRGTVLIAFVFIAFAPMIKLNSAVHLREIHVGFFVLLASYFLVKFVKLNSVLYLLLSVASLLLASVFHGAVFTFIFGLPFYLIFFSKSKPAAKLFFVVISVIVVFFVIQNIGLGKLAVLQEADDVFGALLDRRQSYLQARTLYLTGLTPTSAFDVFWQAPIRMFYFAFKPFIWDVRGFGDVLALIDALMWVMITILLYRNRDIVFQNKEAVLLLFCLLVVFFTFSYGTTNFGTAIRHRTKFYIIALVLVAPFLPKLRFGRRRFSR